MLLLLLLLLLLRLHLLLPLLLLPPHYYFYFYNYYYDTKLLLCGCLLQVLLARLRRPHFSHFHWTSDPVFCIPTARLIRTSGAVLTEPALSSLCPSTPSREFPTSNTRTTSFGGSWKRSERWTGLPLRGRGGCRNPTKSRRFHDGTDRGRGAGGKSWSSFGRRTKI